MTLYFPPAGGGGGQRPLKLAQYLPALGIETHVLAPSGLSWIHEDAELRAPTQAWVHRARYLGPKGRKPAEELHGTEGLERALVQASLAGRRLLVPDESVTWNLTAIPAAIRIARRHGIDAVLTTSPPGSVHLVGAAVKRATGPAGSPTSATRSSPIPIGARERRGPAQERRRASRARRVGGRRLAFRGDRRGGADSTARAVVTIPNGCDFDDFGSPTGLGSASASRTPAASASATRARSCRRTTCSTPSLPRRLRPPTARGSSAATVERSHAPRVESSSCARPDALLLLIPEAGGRGKGVLSGKVFEYLASGRPILAAVPPDGAAAELIRETGAGVVVPPDDVDALKAALVQLEGRFRDGGLPDVELPEEARERLSRRARCEETAELLRSLL